MKQTIMKSFESDGRFAIMRSVEMQLSVITDIMEEINIANANVVVPVGEELSVDDEESAIPQEFSDNESDGDQSDDD